MTTAQPGQEQRMVTDAMRTVGLKAFQKVYNSTAYPPPSLLDEIYSAMAAARPTADLGEDGEFVERLRIMARRYDLGAALPDDDLIRVTLLEAAARLEECRALLSRSGDD